VRIFDTANPLRIPKLTAGASVGFEQHIPGEQLAEAAGLSVSRVYQIRDGRR